MIVYLVRHGIAEEIGPACVRADTERRLTREGRRRTREVAQGLRALGIRPGRIGSSPHVRAHETAEILHEILGIRGDVEPCTFLADGPETASAVAWLMKRKSAEAMLVGHNPYLAETASELLTNSRGVKMTLKRAAVCGISFEGPPAPGRGTLEFLLQPRHLRGSAR